MSRSLRSAVLPGALLALLVTCGSLLALVITIGLRSDQRPPLSFGAGEATVTLRETSGKSSSESARAEAAADALRDSGSGAPRRLTAGVAPNPADAGAARSSPPVQPRAVLRGTTRRRSTRRPAAQAPVLATPPASAPAIAAVPAPTPAVVVPAATVAPEVPTRRHPTGRPEGRTPPHGERDRRHGHSDRRRGRGKAEPDAPVPPVPAPVPPAATPDPQSHGKGHQRGYPRRPRR